MIDASVLKQLLACLDLSSFTKFVENLWKYENVSNDQSYINLTELSYKGKLAYEQVMVYYNGIEREKQGYNLIVPFYEPLELFLKPDSIDLFNIVNLNSILKKYSKQVKERISNWSFYTDGEYLLPIIAFVTNYFGFHEDFYQENILPKLDSIVKKNQLDALTKIGTCDSFVELSLEKTSEAFEKFINEEKNLVITINDNRPIVKEYKSE